MKERMKFMALRSTRVGEAKVVLNAYSPEHGRIAIISPIGKSVRGGTRRTSLMPLSIVECQGERRPGNEFFFISETRPLVRMSNTYTHPLKNVIAQFITEFLTLTLHEQPSDETLFEYLTQSVSCLEKIGNNGIANFHLCFILHLTEYLGIEPDWSTFRHGRLFNMREGMFRDIGAAILADSAAETLLGQMESVALNTLRRMTFRNLYLFRMTRDQRNDILDYMLRYYTLHYASLTALKSLDVLRALF